VELTDDEVQNLVDTFLRRLESKVSVDVVEIFGGVVRSRDAVHKDIDLLLHVEGFPSETLLDEIQQEWESWVGDVPDYDIIDVFFTSNGKVMPFRYDSSDWPMLSITETERTGGLSEDDEDIFIGETRPHIRKDLRQIGAHIII